MKQLITLLSFITFFNISAQSVEWSNIAYPDSIVVFTNSIEEFTNGDLFTIEFGFTNINGVINIDNKIRKYSSDGELLLSKNYIYFEYHLYCGFSVIDKRNNTVLTFSSISDRLTDSSFLLTTLWDENLDILNEERIYVGKKGVYHIQGQWTGNDEITMTGSVGALLNQEPYFNIFFQVDAQGRFINKTTYEVEDPNEHVYDIAKNINNNGYISGGGKYFWYLDDSLNVVSQIEKSMGQSWANQFTLKQWTDNSYLFAGSKNFFGNPLKGLIIHQIDDSLSSIKYYEKGDNYVLGFGRKCLDWKNKDNTYFAAFEYWDGGILLFNFDRNLNLNWQQEYRLDDNLNYIGQKMIATEDNGCLLVGNISKYPIYSYASFIIKIKNDHVGTSQLPDGISQIITLYPNPSIGDLQIDIQGEDNVDMTIYDMQGNKLKYINGLREGHNSFDNMDLPAGIYNVQLLKGSKQISTQRWVKM